jgi:N-carbamoylputrescine amidase
MNLALVQQFALPNKTDNLERGLRALDRAAAEGARLVCFAELAFEPFHPRRPAAGLDVVELAEPVPGPTTHAFAEAARKSGVVVVLNLFERAGRSCYDCSPVIDADGRLLGRTRMLHITDYACFHERDYYAPGDTGAPVYDTAIGRLGVAICYDRHFPEYMRALALAGADLVVVPQAGVSGEWPAGLYEGEMRTAAFQNGYFVALCNRVGCEDGMDFSGESFVCAPDGTIIARASKGQEEVLIAEVDLAAAADSHARRLFLQHRRPELYAEWFSTSKPA